MRKTCLGAGVGNWSVLVVVLAVMVFVVVVVVAEVRDRLSNVNQENLQAVKCE